MRTFTTATNHARRDALITARAIRVMGHVIACCNVNLVGLQAGRDNQEWLARRPRAKTVHVSWDTLDRAEYGMGAPRREARRILSTALRETFN